MPELPEVETVRRGLAPVLTGNMLCEVEQRRADLRFPLPENFAARLEGRTVERLERRGKYLLAHLSSGDVLLMHLGMTGRFLVHPPNPKKPGGLRIGTFLREVKDAAKHEHIVFHLADGASVAYSDPRRFGYMVLVAETELSAHPLMKGLGIEPLGPELTAEFLARRALGKKVDLKAFLLDQRIVAGLGNIYVCEALFRAGLSPTRRAATLATRTGKPTQRAHALVSELRSVLNDAIAAGGSSLRDYRHADGALGEFQHTFSVYDREGQPCRRPGCGGTVRRIVQGGRSTFFCPKCQR